MKNKKISYVVLITIIIYSIISLLPFGIGKSHAADFPAGTLKREIDELDDSLYPGYKSLIKNMQASHPNYTFLLYYTGMKWEEVLTAEYQFHNKDRSPKNLVQMSNNYNGMWICPLCGKDAYDNGSWCCASLEALSYMMDPRNSINDSDVFQFKDLEGSDVSYSDIARAVSRYGSYINNAEVVQAIVDASNQYRINGYFLVAKIINEHGANGSVLSNGNGYNGKYVGVYNYFNIKSSGNGASNIIEAGLAHAQNSGWTSRRASILGGAAVVRNSYMDTYSQNTFYYQKFNVSGRVTMASHQYQQNIMAAQSQGTSLKSYYGSEINSKEMVFIIPLFKNMPQTACPRPDTTKANSITYENGVVTNVSTSLTVRASASKSGVAIGKLNGGESIKILRRASAPDANGYYWDLIVSNVDGTYGYASRIVGGDMCITGTGETGTSSGSAGTGTTTPEEPVQPTPSGDFKIENDTEIKATPNTSCENIKSKYSNAIIKNPNGQEISSGNVGTGYTVTIDGKTYTIVKKGDLNGDGLVNIADVLIMLNHLQEKNPVTGAKLEAGKLNNGSSITVADAIVLLNFLIGKSNIGI